MARVVRAAFFPALARQPGALGCRLLYHTANDQTSKPPPRIAFANRISCIYERVRPAYQDSASATFGQSIYRLFVAGILRSAERVLIGRKSPCSVPAGAVFPANSDENFTNPLRTNTSRVWMKGKPDSRRKKTKNQNEKLYESYYVSYCPLFFDCVERFRQAD